MSKDLIVKIASSLGKALGSSSTLFSDFTTENWGVQIPESILSTSSVNASLQQVAHAATKMEEAAIALDDAVAANDNAKIVQAVFNFGLELKLYIAGVEKLVQSIKIGINSSTISDSTSRAFAEAFIAKFPKSLLDYIILSAIENYIPKALFWLKVIGLADWKFETPSTTNEILNGYVKKRLHLERIKNLINDPVNHFQNTYQWGLPSFDPIDFFKIFTEFYNEEDAIVAEKTGTDAFLKYGDFTIKRNSTVSPPGLQIQFIQHFNKTETYRTKVSDTWGINLGATLGLSGGITVNINPPFNVDLLPPTGEVSGEVKSFIDINPEKRPVTIIGSTDLLQLSVDNISTGIGIKAIWDVINNKASLDPLIFAELKGAKLVLGSSDADSFIGILLSNANIEGVFDLGFEYLFNSGLRIKASGGVEIGIPVHQQLGILEINTINLALKILENGGLSFETSAGFKGLLGPLTVTVERIGAKLDMNFKDSTDTKYGLFDLDFGFKPPNGVGLSLDAGVIKGGGYLYFDNDREEYAGALELVFSEWIALKAIGLVTTRLPDGSKGFSMLIIITAEFGSGIQLGFGFTLLGVGGLLGLNRTVKIQPLAEGVRTGAIQSVMFPQNVIANAPRIISDLRQFFPPANEGFLIGPMAKIGWGTPTLVSVSLGIILEFPDFAITILGVIKVNLPTEDAPVLKLQVNFIGRIEPSNNLLWFYAQLYDSRILFITLEGGIGLLVNWGKNSNFVFSVGGFHPQYTPPPLPFPPIPRLAISILNESWAKIRIEGYFAVTSNTVQFGARVELFFGVSAFNIDGHFGFDALFQFNPFYFSFSLSVSLSVKLFGFGLFSIGFGGLLEGPTPWHIKGKGSIGFLFFSISVPFEHTWGEDRQTILPPIEVFPLIEKEFAAITNWEAVVPRGRSILVTLRQLGSGKAGELVLHPVGTLLINQRKVPLKLKLDKFGNQRPADANKFSISAKITGGDSLAVSDTREKFATGEFKNLNISQKLSSPGFELYDSGIQIRPNGEQLKTSMAVKRIIRYEMVIIDNNFKRRLVKFYEGLHVAFAAVYAALFTHFLRGGSVTKSTLSHHYRKQIQPNKTVIKVEPNLYTVAFNDTNKPIATAATQFTSQASAKDYMEEQIALDPNAASRMHIIPNTEVNAA
ncbi:MAG: hypothetical protein KA536_15195 [Saprospiraceae bacterium]|nr:hypothetical protein [Saprospiraceae bacterium]